PQSEVAPEARMVFPLPVIVPLVQERELVMVTSPVPVSVPENGITLKLCAALRISVLLIGPSEAGEKALLMATVPAAKFTIPVGVKVPGGKLCSPPLKVMIPAPESDDPGLSVKLVLKVTAPEA